MTNNLKIAFFGTPEIAVIVLGELKKRNLIPSLIVTNPDAIVGRKQILTHPPVKVWAIENNIPTIQPTSLKNQSELVELNNNFDLFIVVAYGKIMPEWLLNVPKHGTINVHPSLLPKLRGASPIRSAILQNIRGTGVTVMLMDKELDHGPIIAQVKTDLAPEHWPVSGTILDEAMAHQGGVLLATVIPDFIAGKITPVEQNHSEATFCTKITKDMSQLSINPNNLPTGATAYEYLLKIRAFAGWPETFFIYDGKRIKIKNASLSADGTLMITRIIPEGKKEMDWSSYFK